MPMTDDSLVPAVSILDIPEGFPPKDHLFLPIAKVKDSNFLILNVIDAQIEVMLDLPPCFSLVF